MFFRESRKNKVRLGNGKESAVCLRAFAAPQAPRTDRDQGLCKLIPGPLRIRVRLQEAGQALLLVRLQDV